MKRKLVFESYKLTPWQRFRIWKRQVIEAITEAPPKTCTRSVEIFPDDPRWNEKFTMDIVEHRINFHNIRIPTEPS